MLVLFADNLVESTGEDLADNVAILTADAPYNYVKMCYFFNKTNNDIIIPNLNKNKQEKKPHHR